MRREKTDMPRKDEIIGFHIKLFQLQIVCKDADYFRSHSFKEFH